MQKPRGGNAGMMQATIGCRCEISSTIAVDEYSHLHAALRRTDHCLYERISRNVGPENVARQRNASLGRFDGGQHLRVGIVAVAQDRDGIAVLGRSAGDAL